MSERKDTTLDVCSESFKVNKRVSVAAKLRMAAYNDLVRRLKGQSGMSAASRAPSGDRSQRLETMAETALAKQAAAADALSNKAKAATKELGNAQAKFEQQQQSLLSAANQTPLGGAKAGKNSGGKGGGELSNKKRTAQKSFEKVKESRKHQVSNGRADG